jgi:hypothetical protein
VALVLPSWLRQTTAHPSSITISRGDDRVTGVDFGFASGLADSIVSRWLTDHEPTEHRH